MTSHQSQGNEVVDGGIIHRCSCGWTSRPCFSNAMASVLGMEHRDEALKLLESDVRILGMHL